MQRDFLEPGGFGEARQRRISATPHHRTESKAARSLALQGLAGDAYPGRTPAGSRLPSASEKVRGRAPTTIGDPGPMGRILVRGEAGHDIIPELYLQAGEMVIDKPGKGAFYATDLHAIMQNRGIRQLIVTGVTTEVCVNTTVREANDRGYDCLVLEDCVGSYLPDMHEAGLKMIKEQGGIFGWVAHSDRVLAALP